MNNGSKLCFILLSLVFVYILTAAEVTRVSTPTALETLLPWKRTDDIESSTGIQQSEFPPWCSNKEYLAYNSPSATFLGQFSVPPCC